MFTWLTFLLQPTLPFSIVKNSLKLLCVKVTFLKQLYIKYLFLKSYVLSFEHRFCHIHQIKFVVHYILKQDLKRSFRMHFLEGVGSTIEFVI